MCLWIRSALVLVMAWHLLATSHYLYQYWRIFNSTLRNNLQGNLNCCANIFVQENAFENVAWKMVSILNQPQCHLPLVPHINASVNWISVGSDNGSSPFSVPSHYLNQCWLIFNSALRNTLQWNLNWNANIFIQENAFENGVWKMASILSRPQCVKVIV